MALNNLQGLICHKTQQTKLNQMQSSAGDKISLDKRDNVKKATLLNK